MNELLFFGFVLILMGVNLYAFRKGITYMYILIAVYTLMMNIFVVKQFNLFGLAVTGGNALYGAIFLLTDLLSEHHGEKQAVKSVKIGFGVMLLFVLFTQVLILFEPNSFDYADESVRTLFAVTPRILAGSLLAYFIAQRLDIFFYKKLKELTKGKYLFIRNNGSTMLSQLIDTLIFTSVGLTAFSFLPFGGVITPDIFWQNVLFTYIIKLIVAALDTPFLYFSYRLKPTRN
ncbi:queuosine precursor transporter [Saccharicrinis sp. FJH2]|uniref:queuosine precursor transporter n=1 Tax=unclassified Saccharicrinis TaxID=2646859 RepID=UPI0035D44DCA